jgi:hypothetical protein
VANDLSHDPCSFAARFAAGDEAPEVMAWARGGVAAYLRARSSVGLERCLRLPSTQAQFNRMQRDYWLLQAGAALGEGYTWTAAVRLAGELSTFLSRGPWRAWHALDEPPAEVSELRSALFWVAKHGGGEELNARTVHRKFRHFFPKKCQEDLPMIDASETTGPSRADGGEDV